MGVANAVLLYHNSIKKNANTIMEHVNAFKKYSILQPILINTEFGSPALLFACKFDVIILHYSLFGSDNYCIDDWLEKYIIDSKSYKIAFFQDEYHFFPKRCTFIDRCNIDVLYTLLDETYHDQTYYKFSNIKKVYSTLTGYVDDEMVKNARCAYKDFSNRTIDVGYRARKLPFYMGKGAQEKHEISNVFREKTEKTNLKLDISTDECDRLYGKKWTDFLSECQAVLGVEAGVSLFDVTGSIKDLCENEIRINPEISFEEISQKFLMDQDELIQYRQLSPRHFESAALKVCQILYEGYYNGVMKPGIHYISLKKDFSNIDEVINQYSDINTRIKLVNQAYEDLILSGKYAYKEFIKGFDEQTYSSINLELIAEIKVNVINNFILSLDFPFRMTKRYLEYIYKKIKFEIRKIKNK